MSNLSQENFHVKLQFNDEYRRFNVPRSSKYADIVAKIKQILSLEKEFTLKYKDDENEWITISTDIELETGLSFAKSNLLRLLVSVKTITKDSEECDMPIWRKKRMEAWRAMMKKKWEEGGCDNEKGGDCKRWKKWRKWRKWNNDEDCETNEDCKTSEDCGKKWRGGRRGWRKWREECDTKSNDEEGGDCNKWKRWGKRRNWKNDGDCETNEDCGSGESDCKKWRKRKCRGGRRRGEECEDEGETKRKGCGRRRKEDCGDKEERKERRFKRFEDDNVSNNETDLQSGDELLTLEQIKKEIETLRETSLKLKEKVKSAKEGLGAIKIQMKEKRKAGDTDGLISLRGVLKTKKEEKIALIIEMRNTTRRIRTLQTLATSKSN